MGSKPTYHVSKGPFGFLDELFSQPPGAAFDPSAYDAAIAALSGGPDARSTLHTAAQARQTATGQLTSGEVSHFDADWLSGWWKQLAPADTLLAGLREAITHAKTVQKPLEFFWVCVQDQAFQVYYSDGPNQVTVIVLTPLPDPPGGNPHTFDLLTKAEDIWVVKKKDTFDGQYLTKVAPGTATVLGPPGWQVGTVTSGPPGIIGDLIIKQRVHHT
jgi:hypothetical protein